jgi:hypothetical protein
MELKKVCKVPLSSRLKMRRDKKKGRSKGFFRIQRGGGERLCKRRIQVSFQCLSFSATRFVQKKGNLDQHSLKLARDDEAEKIRVAKLMGRDLCYAYFCTPQDLFALSLTIPRCFCGRGECERTLKTCVALRRGNTAAFNRRYSQMPRLRRLTRVSCFMLFCDGGADGKGASALSQQRASGLFQGLSAQCSDLGERRSASRIGGGLIRLPCHF